MRTFISIILIITSGLVGYFNSSPLYDNIRKLRSERDSIESALNKTKEISAAVVKLGEELDSVKLSDFDELNSLLPARLDSIRFFNMINFMAINHGIELKNLSIEKVNTVEGEGEEDYVSGVRSIDISFSTSATYDSFKEFLKDIERSLVLIDVKSIKLSTPNIQRNKFVNLYDYEVILSTYMTE